MVARVQIKRFDTAGDRLSTNDLPVGSLAVNLADGQLSVSTTGEANKDLLGVRRFSTTGKFLTGEIAFYQGGLYKANTDVNPGAWNATQWTTIAYSFSELVTFGLGWNGTLSYNLDNQLETALYSSGDERLRTTLSYASGFIDEALYEYSTNAGSSYSELGTKAFTFTDGKLTSWAWS